MTTAFACGWASSASVTVRAVWHVSDLELVVVDGSIHTGRLPFMMSPATDDLCGLRAMITVSPGPATAINATRTLSKLPFVENSVSFAPTASAKSSCGVCWTAQT